MTDPLDLGALYRQAREQVSELVRSLTPQQLEARVPSCPEWRVHDVVSHLAGVATDIINGRLQGLPAPEHTATQVEERAATPTSIVLRAWERDGSQLEALLAKSGYQVAPVVDVTVHEHDIRGAVGLPGNRSGPLVDLAVRRALDHFVGKVDSAGLAPVGVRDADGTLIAGEAESSVGLQASRFELLRAIYGRRSRAQIERRFEGTDDAALYVDLLCVFDPADDDIVE